MAGPPGFGRILSRLLITLTPHSSERIAIGSGTDVAIESGEIVLIRDDLMDAVAAGVLYPLFHITFRPEFAGLVMALSSVIVISLSLMLKRYVPPAKREKT